MVPAGQARAFSTIAKFAALPESSVMRWNYTITAIRGYAPRQTPAHCQAAGPIKYSRVRNDYHLRTKCRVAQRVRNHTLFWNDFRRVVTNVVEEVGQLQRQKVPFNARVSDFAVETLKVRPIGYAVLVDDRFGFSSNPLRNHTSLLLGEIAHSIAKGPERISRVQNGGGNEFAALAALAKDACCSDEMANKRFVRRAVRAGKNTSCKLVGMKNKFEVWRFIVPQLKLTVEIKEGLRSHGSRSPGAGCFVPRSPDQPRRIILESHQRFEGVRLRW